MTGVKWNILCVYKCSVRPFVFSQSSVSSHRVRHTLALINRSFRSFRWHRILTCLVRTTDTALFMIALRRTRGLGEWVESLATAKKIPLNPLPLFGAIRKHTQWVFLSVRIRSACLVLAIFQAGLGYCHFLETVARPTWDPSPIYSQGACPVVTATYMAHPLPERCNVSWVIYVRSCFWAYVLWSRVWETGLNCREKTAPTIPV